MRSSFKRFIYDIIEALHYRGNVIFYLLVKIIFLDPFQDNSSNSMYPYASYERINSIKSNESLAFIKQANRRCALKISRMKISILTMSHGPWHFQIKETVGQVCEKLIEPKWGFQSVNWKCQSLWQEKCFVVIWIRIVLRHQSTLSQPITEMKRFDTHDEWISYADYIKSSVGKVRLFVTRWVLILIGDLCVTFAHKIVCVAFVLVFGGLAKLKTTPPNRNNVKDMTAKDKRE